MRQEQGPFCPLVSIAYEKAARCALNMCAWYSAYSGSCALLEASNALADLRDTLQDGVSVRREEE